MESQPKGVGRVLKQNFRFHENSFQIFAWDFSRVFPKK